VQRTSSNTKNGEEELFFCFDMSKRARQATSQLPTVQELLRNANSDKLEELVAFGEQLRAGAQEALDKEAAKKKARKPKKGERACFVCHGGMVKDSEYVFMCGAQGPGQDGGWGDVREVKGRGGCGQWAHQTCLAKTRCGLIFVCDECLGDYDCIDCDECNRYY
jgi:hypothetical protein